MVRISSVQWNLGDIRIICQKTTNTTLEHISAQFCNSEAQLGAPTCWVNALQHFAVVFHCCELPMCADSLKVKSTTPSWKMLYYYLNQPRQLAAWINQNEQGSREHTTGCSVKCPHASKMKDQNLCQILQCTLYQKQRSKTLYPLQDRILNTLVR